MVGETFEGKAKGNNYIVYRGDKARDFDLKLQMKIEKGGGGGIQYRSVTGAPWTRPQPKGEPPYDSLSNSGLFHATVPVFQRKGGTLAYIPARCIHSFRVDSRDARLLDFHLPGGFERVITEFGVPAKSRVLPPADLKQPGTAEQMICSIG